MARAIGELPEPGTLDRSDIATLVGVAPIANLYMAAVTTSRTAGRGAGFDRRLVATGTPPTP